MATLARTSQPDTKAQPVELGTKKFAAYQEFLSDTVAQIMRAYPPAQGLPLLADFDIHVEAGRVALIRNQ